MTEPTPAGMCELTAVMVPIAKAWCMKESPDGIEQRFRMLDEADITNVETVVGLLNTINIMRMQLETLYGRDIDFVFKQIGEVNETLWDLAKEDER